MKIECINHLSASELAFIKRLLPMRTYNCDVNAVYRGNIPHVGFILVDGKIKLKKKTKNKKSEKYLDIGAVVGIKELSEGSPFPFDLEIENGATVCIIDKSTLTELIEKREEMKIGRILDHLSLRTVA